MLRTEVRRGKLGPSTLQPAEVNRGREVVEVASGGEGLPMRNAAERNSTTRTARATNRLGRLASIKHGLHGTNYFLVIFSGQKPW